MSVMRCKMPPNPLFFWLSRSIEPQLGTYLRHDGQWTLAPTFGKRSAIIASNGVMLAGPKAPEFDPADTWMLLQNGQTRKLFSGQDVLDAARPLLKAGKPVGLMPVDASFDASTRHVALSMNYYGNLDQDVKHYTCNPVEFLWDGTKLAMVTPQQLPALHHVFAGGYARLSYGRPFKPSLVITLDSAPGMPGSKHAIELQDPANDGYTRLAGFVGDSVWMVDGLEQKAVRRDLRSWQIVEQRELSATVRTIPRKLLRQMESMR